jgi:hypothetical protein
MNHSLRIKLFLAFILPFLVFSQGKKDGDVNENQLRFDDHIYKSYIKTVLCHESSLDMNPPMINFASNQQIEVSFDDLEGGFKTYQYTFYHCDAGWNQDDLMVSEYLSGFFDDQVSNRSSSFNTIVQYTHYEFLFPNTAIKFTKSGNYVVLVYENGNKDEPVFTRRFVIYEDLVTVAANVHQPLGSDKLYNTHEVDFSIFFTKYQITNPYIDLKVIITQNNRWDNAITNLKPMFVKENELAYDYDDGTNCFPAGNEFRVADLRSTKYPGVNTSTMFRDSVSKIFQVFQKADEPRNFKRYVNTRDINGRMLIKANETSSSEIEADYMWVHFFGPYEFSLPDGNLYISGALTMWKFNKENKMIYNEKLKGYEGSLFLKQGYYDYEYLFLNDAESQGEVQQIENNLAQTENDYTIYIYHRTQGSFYDRLISVKNLNSLRN